MTRYCQSPICHLYNTKDRIRGSKGSKVYRTRYPSKYLYNSFCSNKCMHDYLTAHMERIIAHIGERDKKERPIDQPDYYRMCNDRNLNYWQDNTLIQEIANSS